MLCHCRIRWSSCAVPFLRVRNEAENMQIELAERQDVRAVVALEYSSATLCQRCKLYAL